MSNREIDIMRIANALQSHEWYKNTPFEKCLQMAAYQVKQLEKGVKDKKEN